MPGFNKALDRQINQLKQNHEQIQYMHTGRTASMPYSKTTDEDQSVFLTKSVEINRQLLAKKRAGPPTLGELVGKDTKGQELGNIIRDTVKTCGRPQRSKIGQTYQSPQDNQTHSMHLESITTAANQEDKMNLLFSQDFQNRSLITANASISPGTQFQTNLDGSSYTKGAEHAVQLTTPSLTFQMQNSINHQRNINNITQNISKAVGNFNQSVDSQITVFKKPIEENISRFQRTQAYNSKSIGHHERSDVIKDDSIFSNQSKLPQLNTVLTPSQDKALPFIQRANHLRQQSLDVRGIPGSVMISPDYHKVIKMSPLRNNTTAPQQASLSTRAQMKHKFIKPEPKPKQQITNKFGNEFKPRNFNQYSPKKGHYFFVTDVNNNELQNNMINLSGYNKYNEQGNTHNNLVNQVQSQIRLSYDIQHQMSLNKDKIFQIMKTIQDGYNKTLVQGEEDGHCGGIKYRLDPTNKYRLIQEMRKEKLLKEEQVEKIKREKEEKDLQKKEVQFAKIKQRVMKYMQFSKVTQKLEQKLTNWNQNASALMLEERIKSKLSKKANKEFESSETLSLVSNFEEDTQESRIATNNQSKEFLNQKTVKDELFSAVQKLMLSPTNKQPQKKMNVTFDHSSTLVRPSAYRQMLTAKGSKESTPKARSNGMQIKKVLEMIGFKTEKDEGDFKQIASIMSLDQFAQLLENFDKMQQQLKQDRDMRLNKQQVLQNQIQLGLYDHPATKAYFKQFMEAGEANIKMGRMKRAYFLHFLQKRYSDTVAEKMLSFVENMFQSLYRIDLNGFLQIMTDLLNLGLEGYCKFIFTCLSIKNPGIICEHDIFTIFEEFKQQDSYIFYKELLGKPGVPRNFHSEIDTSDQTFFDVFYHDVTKTLNLIQLKKKIMGTTPVNTKSSQALRNLLSKSNSTSSNLETEIMKEIIFILKLIIKGTLTKEAQNKKIKVKYEVVKLILASQDIVDVHNNLCEFTAANLDFEFKQSRKEDKKRATSPKVGEIANTSTSLTFKVPPKINFCLGLKHNKNDKIAHQCVFVTFDEFLWYFSLDREHVSSIVSDYLYTVSGNVFDLALFEKEFSQYRTTAVQPYTKILVYPKKLTSYIDPNAVDANTFGYGEQDKLKFKHDLEEDTENVKVWKQVHVINDPYNISPNMIGEVFEGMTLRRALNKKRQANTIASIQISDAYRDISTDFANLGMEQEQASLFLSMPPEYALLLSSFRKHFGYINFINLFRIFYFLSNIPKDCQNNPMFLKMDQNSCVRGFRHVFNINNEELAVRFYQLFAIPEDKPRMPDVDFFRFLHVSRHLIEVDKLSFYKQAFSFYDYDRNGSIGAVDIMNFIKFLDEDKMRKINDKYQVIFQQKQLMMKAKKDRTLDHLLLNMNIVPHDDFIDQSATSSSDDEEIEQSSTGSKEVKQILEGTKSISYPINQINKSYSKSSGRSSSVKDQRTEKDQKSLWDSPRRKGTNEATFTYINRLQQDHTNEQNINQSWNMVLFEIKVLHDYFVDKSVIPKTTAAESTFLNFQHYYSKFCPMMQKNFVNVENPAQIEEALKTPAIIHFIREKLLMHCHKIGKQDVYNDDLKQIEFNPDGCKICAIPHPKTRLIHEADEREFVDKLIAFCDRPETPITKELKEMAVALIRLQNLPQDQPPVSLD